MNENTVFDIVYLMIYAGIKGKSETVSSFV